MFNSLRQIIVAGYLWEMNCKFSNIDSDKILTPNCKYFKTHFAVYKMKAEKKRSETIHVVRYGSEPLKTYLPDSDIDLTIIVSSNFMHAREKSYFHISALE